METTVQQMKALFEDFLKEDAKFDSGNSAAGTRARKALAELGKLCKARRTEIQDVKNAEKAE